MKSPVLFLYDFAAIFELIRTELRGLVVPDQTGQWTNFIC